MTAMAEPASSAPSAVDPVTGVQFYDLSNPFGHDAPLWPYFPDVKIERFHEGAPFIDQVPLSSYFGTGVVVSIPKEKWEVITAEDLERATPEIRAADTGKRVTFAAFPWRWEKGDGCIVRLVAMVDPEGIFRMETGSETAA